MFFSEATNSRQKCVPGTKFKMDCNTCQCSLDGHVAMCSVAYGNRIKRGKSIVLQNFHIQNTYVGDILKFKIKLSFPN